MSEARHIASGDWTGDWTGAARGPGRWRAICNQSGQFGHSWCSPLRRSRLHALVDLVIHRVRNGCSS